MRASYESEGEDRVFVWLDLRSRTDDPGRGRFSDRRADGLSNACRYSHGRRSSKGHTQCRLEYRRIPSPGSDRAEHRQKQQRSYRDRDNHRLPNCR